MTQLPNLKFDKNRKFLTEQLEIQKAKVNNITDIISNIKSISQSKTCNVYYLNDLLDTGNGLIAELNANIASIETLFASLEEITSVLGTILSPENQKGKTKSYYIDSFTKLEKDVTDYSKNFSKVMKKLENDNTTYDTFIASCNLNSSDDSSLSSNPTQIRQILERNLVEQENTFVSIADSYKAENDIPTDNDIDNEDDDEIEEEIISIKTNDENEDSDSDTENIPENIVEDVLDDNDNNVDVVVDTNTENIVKDDNTTEVADETTVEDSNTSEVVADTTDEDSNTTDVVADITTDEIINNNEINDTTLEDTIDNSVPTAATALEEIENKNETIVDTIAEDTATNPVDVVNDADAVTNNNANNDEIIVPTTTQELDTAIQDVSNEITAEDLALLTDEDILNDEVILNEVDLDMVTKAVTSSNEELGINDKDSTPNTETSDITLEDFEVIESEPKEINLESIDNTLQVEPAIHVEDTTVDVPVIESFIDENMELPDIQIKDEDFVNSDIIGDGEMIESISLSDDLQEIIDDVNNSNDTEEDTINAISEGFEGLMNASTSYTIDALKKSNRDFYDNLRNLSFEYEDFSTPISQLGKTPKKDNYTNNDYQVKETTTTPKKVEVAPIIKEKPKSENKSFLENVISNRNVTGTIEEEPPQKVFNVINNSNDTIVLNTSDIRKFTNVINTSNDINDENVEDDDDDIEEENVIIETDNDVDVINDIEDSKTDEESLFNIQDEMIANIDEVDILADALNNSNNITITMQDKDSDEEAIVKGSTETTVAPRTTTLSKDKIEKIIKAEADNETLIISEKNNKIYLPYKMSEIKNYMHSYPDSYTDASDVVKQEFILDLGEFMQHPSKTRFQETYTLIRNRDGKSVASAVLYGLKLVKKSNLSPAVIAACKHKEELDRYLNCLKENKLDEFKSFNIMYEINPHKT